MKNAIKMTNHYTDPVFVSECIFEGMINPTEIDTIESTADVALRKFADSELEIYVSGISSMLIACVRACLKYNIDVTFYHYDKATNSYRPQKLTGNYAVVDKV